MDDPPPDPGGAPEGLPFACDAVFLRQMKMVNLTTRFGDLDLSFDPPGTAGYDDLSQRAVHIEFRDGLFTRIASLEDIIKSKEAANRAKDRLALPTLRLLLQEINARAGVVRSRFSKDARVMMSQGFTARVPFNS